MVKEKRILTYFIGWLIIGFCILFVGINNVFAATYDTNYNWEIRYYDNGGSSATTVGSSWNESLQTYISNNITTAAGSYGAGVAFSSPIPLIQNHTYTLSLYFPDRNNIALSSKSVLLLGSNLDDAKNKYVNEIWTAETIQSKVLNNSIIQFVFKANYSLNYIFLPWTTTNTATQNYFFTQVIMEDLGSEGVSINDINSSLSSQTNELNNSIQNSTNEIKGEIDDMEQSIIDSNKETQDVIKDQFNDCHDSYNLFNKNNYKTKGNGLGFDISALEIGKTYTLSSNKPITVLKISNYTWNYNSVYYVDRNGFYKYTFEMNRNENISSDEQQYLFFQISKDNDTFVTNISELDGYEIMLNEGSSALSYEPYGEEICTNKIDETNDKLNDIQGSINDSNVDSSLNNAGSFFENFTTTDHGGLSGIITAPLVAINQMLNNSCSPMTTNFKGKEISLPCGYDFWAKLGGIQDFLNLVLGGLLCYQIIIKLYKLIEKIKNPEDDRVEVMKL